MNILDYTQGTYQRLNQYILKNTEYDTIWSTVWDSETNTLVRGTADKRGAQVNLHAQGETGMTSAYIESHITKRGGTTRSQSAYNLIRPEAGRTKLNELHKFAKGGTTTEQFMRSAGVSWSGFSGWDPRLKFPATQESMDWIVKNRPGLLTPESEVVQRLSQAYQPGKGKLGLIVGHNVKRFDTTMARGIPGFAGVGPDTGFLDTMFLTHKMFPELSRARVGTMTLESLGGVLRGDKDVLKLYGLEEAPREFIESYSMYKPALAGLAHTADYDSLLTSAVVEANLRRANTDAVYANIFKEHLERENVLGGSLSRKMFALADADPTRVAGISMAHAGDKVSSSLRRAFPAQNVVYSANTRDINKLYSQLSRKYGSSAAADVRQFAEFVAGRGGENVRFVADAGLTNLRVGMGSDLASYSHLPLQSYDIGRRGIVNFRGSSKSARAAGFVGASGITEVEFSKLFYKGIRKFYNNKKVELNSMNFGHSLKTAIAKTMNTSLFVGENIRAPLSSLLQSNIVTGGLGQETHAIMRGYELQLANVAFNPNKNARIATFGSDLSRLYTELAENQTTINTNLGSYWNKNARSVLSKAYARREGIMDELAAAYTKVGAGAAYSFGKPENFLASEGGAPVITSPRMASHLGSFQEERDIIKGRHQIKNISDITVTQRKMMSRAGIRTGSPVMKANALSQRLARNAVQASVFVAENYNGGSLADVFEDATVFSTKRASRGLARPTRLATVELSNLTIGDIKALNKFLGHDVIKTSGEGYFSNYRPTKFEDQIVIGGRMTRDRASALRQLRKTSSSNIFSAVAPLKGKARARLAEAVLEGNKLKLTFNRADIGFGGSDSILMGPLGRFRSTVGGVLSGRLNEIAEAAGVDYLMSADNAKALSNVDFLVTHRLNVLKGQSLMSDFSKFAGLKMSGSTLIAPAELHNGHLLKMLDIYYKKKIGEEKYRLALGPQWNGIKTKVGKLTGKKFYTDVFMRLDADLDINPLKAIRITNQQYETYGRSFTSAAERVRDPLAAGLRRLMIGQTGISQHGARPKLAGTSFSRFIDPLLDSSKVSPSAVIAELEGADYVLKQVPSELADRYKVGQKLHVPKPGKESPWSRGSLAGTVFDPELTKQGMYIRLQDDIKLTKGKKDIVFNRPLLNIPHDDLLPIRSKEDVIISSTHPAFKYATSLRKYREDRKAGAPLIAETIEDTLKKITGKEGYLAKSTSFKVPTGFRARIQGFLPGEIGRLPSLKEIAGSKEAVENVFTGDVYLGQMEEMIRLKYKGRKQARLLSKVRKAADTNGYLMSFLRADPMQRADHMMYLRLRVLKKERARSFEQLGARGVTDIRLSPYVLHMLERDTDKDVINIGMLLAGKGEMLADSGEEARAFKSWEEQTRRHRSYLRKWRQKVEEGAIKFSPNETVDPFLEATKIDKLRGLLDSGTVALTKEGISAHMGMKISASFGYTLTKQPRRLLSYAINEAGNQNYAANLRRVLMDVGVPEERLTAEVLSPLTSLSADKLVAADNLYQAVMQSGVAKAGSKEFQSPLADAFLEIGNNAAQNKSNVVESVRKATSAFEQLFADPEMLAKLKEGSAGHYITGSGSTATNILGEVYGTLIHASAKMGPTIFDPAIAQGAVSDPTRVLGMFGDIPYDEVMSTAAAASPSTPQIEKTLVEGMGDALTNAKSSLSDFIRSDAGKLALWGAGAIGAFAFIRGLGGSEIEPPAFQPPYQGAPLPAPPMVEMPQDREPPQISNISMRPVAKMKMGHPPAIKSMPRPINYSPISRPAVGYANNTDLHIVDKTSSISQHQIAMRMRQLSERDFTY